jgi:hypothetical protein
MKKQDVIGIGILAVVLMALLTVQMTTSFIGSEIVSIPQNKAGDTPIFILETNFPAVSDTIEIFRVKTPIVTQGYVEEIGKKLAFAGDAGAANPGTIGMVDGDGDNLRHLMVYEASGAIWYAIPSKMHPVVASQPNLPSEEEAKSIATEFLYSKGLIKEGKVAKINKVVADQQVTAKKGFNEIISEYNVTLQVQFARAINNLPVIGPGNKLKVFIGEGGEVVGLFKVWRDFEPYKNVKVKTPEQAYKDLVAGNDTMYNMRVGGDKVVIKEIYLAYWMEPADSEQKYILPVYVFAGDDIDSELGYLGPFTECILAV